MGEVYKARDTRLDRTVAIKVLPEHVASDPELKQRFEREAKTISSLNHGWVILAQDDDEEDDLDDDEEDDGEDDDEEEDDWFGRRLIRPERVRPGGREAVVARGPECVR